MARLSAEVVPARLAAAAGRGPTPLPPAIWIHGDEPLLAIEAADAVRAAARAQGFSERQTLQVDRSFKPAMLAAQAGSLSLFAQLRLIDLRFPAGGKPGKEVLAALAELLRNLPDDLRLLISSARLDKAALASEAVSRIERSGWLVAAEPVTREALPRWIGQRLAAQGQQADDATLALLADRTEGNLLAAHQEIRKLALLCPPGRLGFDAVRAAVLDVSRFDAMDAVDAMLAGDAARTVRALDALRAEGEPPQRLLWWLADAIRKLARLHDARARGVPLPTAFQEQRVWGAAQAAYRAALSRVDARTARQALLAAAEIDRIGKGVAPGDPWRSMVSLAARLAGAPVLG